MEIVKEQNKMMPADPYMERLVRLEEKMDRILEAQKGGKK